MQFQPSSMPDEWGTTQDGQTRPRVVKRGIDDDLDQVPDGSQVNLSKCGHIWNGQHESQLVIVDKKLIDPSRKLG